jgi:hypothetical protein
VFELLARGMSNPEICKQLFITEATRRRPHDGWITFRAWRALPASLMVAAVRSARSRIPRSIFWLIAKLSNSVGSTISRAHPRATRQAAVVAANIRTLITDDGTLNTYEKIPTLIAIPLGPEGGAGSLGDGLASAATISELKGREMGATPTAA